MIGILRAIEVAGEIAADRRPRVAAVVAAVDAIGRRNTAASTECGLMIVGESQCQRPRRPPRPPPRPWPAAPARRRRSRRRSRAGRGVRTRRDDADADAGAQIEALQAAILRLRVDGRRILGIDARLEAVAAADAVPVTGADAGAVHASATARRRCRCPARRRRCCRTAARCRSRSGRTATAAGS